MTFREVGDELNTLCPECNDWAIGVDHLDYDTSRVREFCVSKNTKYRYYLHP